MRILLIIFISGFIFLSSCINNDEDPAEGNLRFVFDHSVEGSSAEFDKMIYENEAGNIYEITNIQWFISDLSLSGNNGDIRITTDQDWIHYIDTDIPASLSWDISNGIPTGEYSSVNFIFGIKGEKNVPNMFTDPPESNMLWPYHMGGDMGGYHYMKLNGFWRDQNEERTPFNFHLGVGQEYDENGEVTEFIQNWFECRIPVSDFSLQAGETLQAILRMNIENWFRNPHSYDHNLYGSRIMNNQEAMNKIRENGVDVFTIEVEGNEKVDK